MTSSTLLIVIAVVAGAAVAIQAQFMGQLDHGVGTLESMFITYGGGGLLIAIVTLAERGGNLAAWRSVPTYTLSAGILGLMIVGGIGYTAPRLGLVVTFTLMVTTQFVVSALVSHFGLLGTTVQLLNVSRMAGIGLLLAGVWLIIR
jgi:transporter family-2 protein